MKAITLLAAAIAAVVLPTAASALTLSNEFTDGVNYFGAPDTTTYGEVFTVTEAAELQSWSYYAESGSGGSLHFVLAGWTGTMAADPSYSSAPLAYAGGASALTFDHIDAQLAPGTYIAYITVAGDRFPATDITLGGSADRGAIGRGFTFSNTNGADPQIDQAWFPVGAWTPSDLQYSATFDTSPVPEPVDAALMLAGLPLLAGVSRRRRRDRA